MSILYTEEEKDMAALEAVKSMKESFSRRRVDKSHEVEFAFSAPSAKKVCIAGQFNDWNMASMPMKKRNDGIWRIKLKLSPGKYEYKYVVNGTWGQDMSCSETVLNPFGTHNCVITVE